MYEVVIRDSRNDEIYSTFAKNMQEISELIYLMRDSETQELLEIKKRTDICEFNVVIADLKAEIKPANIRYGYKEE